MPQGLQDCKLKGKNTAFRIYRKISFDFRICITNGHTSANHVIKIQLNIVYKYIKEF